MRALLLGAAVALVLVAASSAAVQPALPCQPGELRATMKITNIHGGGKRVALTVLNIGLRCKFQTMGVIASGGATRSNVSSKRGTAVYVPRRRSVRLQVTWRNWCGSVGPSQIVLKLAGKGKELALPFFPAPACVAPGKQTTVVLGKPALVPKQ